MAKKQRVFRSMDQVEREFFEHPRERRLARTGSDSIGAAIADRIIDAMQRPPSTKKPPSGRSPTSERATELPRSTDCLDEAD
jgi:hypothetical protein